MKNAVCILIIVSWNVKFVRWMFVHDLLGVEGSAVSWTMIVLGYIVVTYLEVVS